MKIPSSTLCDYSSSSSRESTVRFLLDYAYRERYGLSAHWERMRRYYDGTHDTMNQIAECLGNLELPFTPAQSTDGFINVESQIEGAIPDFEFSGRGAEDAAKASQREKIVRYIVERNDMEYKNSRNERVLGITGSAVWKVCWDISRQNPLGDVAVINPKPQQIFPDPASKTVDGCEWIGYTYKLHKAKAVRTFGDDLKRYGIKSEELFSKRGTLQYDSAIYDEANQTVDVTEWWFRQPEDGEMEIALADGGKHKCAWRAGDIGLCILINDTEVRYVPRYWLSINCDMYPFVIYSKTPDDDSIWGKSELDGITHLIDASDRELAYAQINSAFMSNDIVVAEENAFSDDSEPENRPGAVWKLRPGMMGKVARLGNIAYSEGALHSNSSRWRQIIQETTGNYDTYNGAEPVRVTTATGIALLNERARLRIEKKRINRQAGFRRLYELIDRVALENYDDGRVIAIGAAESFIYAYSAITTADGYLPEVDIKINVGDGLRNSKAFTISALSDLIRTPVNETNYKIVQAFVRLIDIPQSAEICREIEGRFGGGDVM